MDHCDTHTHTHTYANANTSSLSHIDSFAPIIVSCRASDTFECVFKCVYGMTHSTTWPAFSLSVSRFRQEATISMATGGPYVKGEIREEESGERDDVKNYAAEVRDEVSICAKAHC